MRKELEAVLKPRQERSTLRRDRIAQAAVTVIGRDGITQLTHRSVASEAAVPLAATTYYYSSRSDIVGEASERLLSRYALDFARLADRLAQSPSVRFEQFAARTVMGGADKHRLATLAWCEMMLNCARNAAGHAMARRWFRAILEIWTGIASAMGAVHPSRQAQSAIDMVTGLIFAVLPLGLNGTQVAAVLRPGGDEPRSWAPLGETMTLPAAPARGRKRGDEARSKILAAAAAIVAAEGPGGVTLRKVASSAGVAPAAPSYYFPTAQDLLNATLQMVFEDSKHRYRDAMAEGKVRPSDSEQLADLTAAIFLREATEYRAIALAAYPLRLEAARRPDLRSTVWGVIDDQDKAWARQLDAVGICGGERCGLLLQSLFLGKLVRVLATAVSTAELAAIRREFAEDLAALKRDDHWAKNWYI